ncbi:MAG: lactate racemase domain-containing protein [Bacteroidota bacterium]|nr:lactate racemase domain-containing protein [Bacteroidota bacterium]MDP4233537.1 lactate racemase domain-containing protein [Bacteroidota bacterium]MDP4287723.1 lactate racemase domain-containing protein [Bacteroidota bacterium]
MHFYYTYYPKVREIEIPDANLIGVYGPLETAHPDREKILRDAFESPVNSPRLEELATPEDRVLIVLDDGLEPTPTVFPFYHVVQALHAAGVPDANVSVLIANGGHRASTGAEVDRKIGAEMHRRFAVYQSALNARDDSWHTFGTARTEGGVTSVIADRRLRDASLIVGIGGTYPSRFKGFTGGGSLVFPGLANESTRGEICLESAEQPSIDVLGHADNPGRKLVRSLLQFIPAFKFCVDVVVDRTLTTVACIAGSPQSVYRVSADVAARMTNFTIPEKADIVVIDPHPFDTNIFQAANALYASLGVLKEGGEIICVAPLNEAISALSGELAKQCTKTREGLIASSRSGDLSHHPQTGARLAAIREVIDVASRITFVTNGAGTDDPAKFGFACTNDAQAALNDALARKGASARVALISHGGLAVPRVA